MEWVWIGRVRGFWVGDDVVYRHCYFLLLDLDLWVEWVVAFFLLL